MRLFPQKTPRTHHFFALRHCPRSTDEDMDFGLGDDYADERSDYTAQRPDYGVGSFQCTQQGVELVKATGKWLIESGTIDPGSKIQWEIIADDSDRDIDSAKALWDGILEGLNELRDRSFVSQHDHKVRIDSRFSRPGDQCNADDIVSNHAYHAEIKSRLLTAPRPDMSFGDALDLLQSVAGQGNVGDLRSYIPHGEPEYDEDEETIVGAPYFLNRMGADMFLSRIAGADPIFAPGTSQADVFKLYQFHSWYRSITDVDNSWDAGYGAAQVRAMLMTLRDGYYMKKPAEDTYDTRVTIIFGHDGDLDTMATALGARWVLKPPFISGPGGEFLETPPTSGIHAKRNLDTDRVDLSFVYPLYSTDPNAETFQVDFSGTLEYTPFLFIRGIPDYFKTTDKSVFLEGSKSLELLEEHTMKSLSNFIETTCLQATEDYWKTHREVSGNETVTDEYYTTGSASRSFTSPLALALETIFGIVVLALLWHFFCRRDKKYDSLDVKIQKKAKEFESRKELNEEGSTTFIGEEEAELDKLPSVV